MFTADPGAGLSAEDVDAALGGDLVRVGGVERAEGDAAALRARAADVVMHRHAGGDGRDGTGEGRRQRLRVQPPREVDGDDAVGLVVAEQRAESGTGSARNPGQRLFFCTGLVVRREKGCVECGEKGGNARRPMRRRLPPR